MSPRRPPLALSRPHGSSSGPLRAKSGNWCARDPLKVGGSFCRDTYTIITPASITMKHIRDFCNSLKTAPITIVPVCSVPSADVIKSARNY